MVNLGRLKQKEDDKSAEGGGRRVGAVRQVVTWGIRQGVFFFLTFLYFKTRNRGYSWDGQKEGGGTSGENKNKHNGTHEREDGWASAKPEMTRSTKTHEIAQILK